MKTEDIQNLLAKFYEGKTSSEEEAVLTDFFRQVNLPEEWKKDRELVLSLSEFEPEIPIGLEEKLNSFIDSLEKSETVSKKPTIKMWKYVAGIAASVLLIMGVGIWSQSQKTNEKSLLADTYKTPEQAQEATLEALQLFSQHFAKGTESLQKAEKRIEETQQIVKRSLIK